MYDIMCMLIIINLHNGFNTKHPIYQILFHSYINICIPYIYYEHTHTIQ